MSFITTHCRRIDAQLDRMHLSGPPSATTSTAQDSRPRLSPRLLALQASIRALSTSASEKHTLRRASEIQSALSALSDQGAVGSQVVVDEDEVEQGELEWVLVGKATVQVYGLVLQEILEWTVRLAEEGEYWEEVLESRGGFGLGVYGVQILPGRVWEQAESVWEEARRTVGGGEVGTRGVGGMGGGLKEQWGDFYGVVRRVVRERSVRGLRSRVLSPVARLRGEVRKKQTELRKLRLRNANALGVLLGEGLANESAHGDGLATPSPAEEDRHKWKVSLARNVALTEAVLAKVHDDATPVDKFDSAVAELTEDDPLFDADVYDSAGNFDISALPPSHVAERLTRVLALALPQYTNASNAALRTHGKPSVLVRYWLPATLGLLSSSTILRILSHRRAEILQWIRDLGATTLDFWTNWVLEPTRKVVATIRHDAESEVSIMSKRSLEGDRASLERMVVDFARDNPPPGNNNSNSSADLTDLRERVREGDLTPVLLAYEKSLQSPLMGTLRGNLVRTLLIQVQKTKVDVEVAMRGIDNLLKSQELVFGFIGLTPGLLITYSLASYLRSSLTRSSSTKSDKKRGGMLRQLRNMDRVLSQARANEFGEVGYGDMGLVLAEAHVLREKARGVLGRSEWRDFGRDLEGVCDVRVGLEAQRRGVERVRWGYCLGA